MERSLPPDVEGPVYGELRVCVDLIDWSIARPPPVCQVRARFWGEKGYGCVFRPDDSTSMNLEDERELEHTSSNTVFYCVRVKSLLFSRYLKDMNVMTLEVLDGKSYTVLGKSKVNVGEGADNPIIVNGLHKIFGPNGGAIGELRVRLVVDYFEIPLQADHSFEELEDIIEMDTPLPLQHSVNIPLYSNSVGAAATARSLPPLLRSSVASVGDYEGSSEGEYLDVDASLSDDASSLRFNVAQSCTSFPPRKDADVLGRSPGECSNSSNQESCDAGDGNSESNILSFDSVRSSGNLIQSTSKSGPKHQQYSADAVYVLQSHEQSDSLHSDSSSPREKDASMMRAAHLRSVALQQSSKGKSLPTTQVSDFIPVAPPGSVDVLLAINSSVLDDSQRSHLKFESAAQPSPNASRVVALSDVSVLTNLPDRVLDHTSRFVSHRVEQTVDRSLMTDETGQVTAPNPPPAWNHILDSLSARLGAMRSRVVIAEQKLNSASSSTSVNVAPHFHSHSMPQSDLHHTPQWHYSNENQQSRAISFADEPSLSARLHVAPYSPVRGSNSSAAASNTDGTLLGESRSEKIDNVTVSELADVFNSQDEAALLSSLFFAKSQQPSVSKHQQQNSASQSLKSATARKAPSASVNIGNSGTSATRSSGPSPIQSPNTPTKVSLDSNRLQTPISSPSSSTHSWFVSVDSVIFANSSQKVSVKDVRVVVKVPPAKSVTELISPSVVRVRWLGSRLPRHSLAVVFVDATQASQRVTVPSAPVIIIEVWEKNAKTLEPHIVGIVRCPVRAGVTSSPAGSRITKFTSSGVLAAVLDSGNFIYDGTASIRNPLSGTDVGHASISILQQTSDIVDGVVCATDAAITISGAVRCHLSRKICRTLKSRQHKKSMRKELPVCRPSSRRAVVEIDSDCGTAVFSHTFKVEVQGLFGIGDWSGASSVCLRAQFPGQKEWIESGRTAIIKGSAAALASSSYSWVLPANQHLSSVLTNADTGVSAGFCVNVHDGADSRKVNPPMRQYCIPTNDLLSLSAAAMEICLSNTAHHVPNGGVKKIFRIPAREFGQGCVLKLVMHCRVLPSSVSTLTLKSLSNSSHPKFFPSNNSIILGVICASGLQTAAESALAAAHSNSSLSVACIDGINAFATVSFTPPASHLLPGLNGSHVYVTTVASMTFAPKWDWKVQFPLQLSRDVCSAIAASSLTVSVYHRPMPRSPSKKEEDVLIGHAAAPLAHLFTKHSGLATWVPLVCGKSGLPVASILLFSNIEATVGESKKDATPSALLSTAFDIDDTAGVTGVLEASLEELILVDGTVASMLGAHNFSTAKVTWRLPGLDVIEVTANLGSQVSSAGQSTSRVVSLKSSVMRTFDLSIDVAHCMNERALEIDLALCSPDGDDTNAVALGTCYVDVSSLLDRPSQFELPTQARWSSGVFAVIHPSGSRCGAAVRVRLQLKLQKKPEYNISVTPPRTNILPSFEALERSSAPLLSAQLPPLPRVTATTLILESVRHVILPREFEIDSVFLSLTTILNGQIVHNTAPMLYQGKIEWEDVISLHSKANDCDNMTVILSAQNQSNTKATILGSSEIDLSMLQLMKCISGWYSILDSSGNCVAYVKLRIDSKSSVVAEAPFVPGQAPAFVSTDFAPVVTSTPNYTVDAIDPPEVSALNYVSHSSSVLEVSVSDICDYSAPSLEELRSKMKELDSVSALLKNMLLREDCDSTQRENGAIDSDSIRSPSIDDSGTTVTDNFAPQALIAYAGIIEFELLNTTYLTLLLHDRQFDSEKRLHANATRLSVPQS
jgi:hypothetical protein